MIIGEDIRVEVSEFRGKKYVMIRRFYQDASGEMRPGRQGINMKMEEWEDFVEKFPKIIEQLKENE